MTRAMIYGIIVLTIFLSPGYTESYGDLLQAYNKASTEDAKRDLAQELYQNSRLEMDSFVSGMTAGWDEHALGLFRQSQLAWEKHLQADATWLADSYRGIPGYKRVYWLIMNRLTRDRILELRHFQAWHLQKEGPGLLLSDTLITNSQE